MRHHHKHILPPIEPPQFLRARARFLDIVRPGRGGEVERVVRGELRCVGAVGGVVEAVDGEEDGGGAGVGMEAGERGRVNDGGQGAGGGRAEFAGVVGAVAAEEEEG